MTAGDRHSSNTNDRGSAEQRRARKNWMLDVWGADVDVVLGGEFGDLIRAFREPGEALPNLLPATFKDAEQQGVIAVIKGLGRAACRCFRCGKLVTYETMEVDRIKPGADGGTYARNNIRPACCGCNKKLEGEARKRRNAKRKKRNEQAKARRLDAQRRGEEELAYGYTVGG